MPPWRPTKWKREFNQAIIDYFTIEDDKVYREHQDDKGKVQILPHLFPCFEGFAQKIGVACSTIVDWANENEANNKKYPGFHAAYTRAKELQKQQLVRGTMAGAYNNQFAIFLAKNITDMRDVQTVEGGDPSKPIILKNDFSSKEEAKKYLEDIILKKNNKPKGKK